MSSVDEEIHQLILEDDAFVYDPKKPSSFSGGSPFTNANASPVSPHSHLAHTHDESTGKRKDGRMRLSRFDSSSGDFSISLRNMEDIDDLLMKHRGAGVGSAVSESGRKPPLGDLRDLDTSMISRKSSVSSISMSAKKDNSQTHNNTVRAVNERRMSSKEIKQHSVYSKFREESPFFTVGDLKISKELAHLYGVEKLKSKILPPPLETQAKKLLDKSSLIQRIEALSSTKRIEEDENVNTYTFRPVKSSKAKRVMLRTGYDFIQRFENEDREETRNRLTSVSSGLGKSALEALMKDYEARIDKLGCPNCRRSQSFQEFQDTIRICQQCRVRFQKLHVSSGAKFLTSLKKHEEKRLLSLQEIENQMYGEMQENQRRGFRHHSEITLKGDHNSTSNYSKDNSSRPRSSTRQIEKQSISEIPPQSMKSTKKVSTLTSEIKSVSKEPKLQSMRPKSAMKSNAINHESAKEKTSKWSKLL